MISLLLLIGLLFSSSAALSSDTGLMCAIDMGEQYFQAYRGRDEGWQIRSASLYQRQIRCR
jgi:hypothetical protein